MMAQQINRYRQGNNQMPPWIGLQTIVTSPRAANSCHLVLGNNYKRIQHRWIITMLVATSQALMKDKFVAWCSQDSMDMKRKPVYVITIVCNNTL